jgi:hypothetical protein
MARKTATAVDRFTPVSLSFNIGGLPADAGAGAVAACIPGGSVICRPGTRGCKRKGPFTCAITSCTGKSAFETQFEAHILVESEQLDRLQARLRAVLAEVGG